MRRQIIACGFVGLALLLLFKGSAIITFGGVLLADLLPGGLTVSYYKGKNFEELSCRQTCRKVERSYDAKLLANSSYGRIFSARWEGFLMIPDEAEYKFYLQSIDGSRLYIDGDKVIDRWDQRVWSRGSHGRKALLPGKHAICIEHCNESGEAAIRLSWCGGSIPVNTIVKEPYITKK